ncbi:MAG: Gfo/Idh/MocA family oxidoreductase [Anaerolineales bacterium]|nr:Gfo/Idh/MocA family oxidoreductase [Anaerolineales bacterium]
MKFLIAGLGSIGRRHLRNLRACGEEDLLLYRTHQATLPDDDLAGLPVVTELQAALAHKPDVVIIANPTALHLDVAIPAAEAGCTILLEKPVSHSLEGLDELAATARRSGSRILVGFQFRFHPTLQMARDLIAAGAIGRLLVARVHFGEYLPAWHPWEDYRQGYAARSDLGGGVVLTQSHSLDYLPWLVGRVDSLWAFVTTLGGLGIDVDDTAEIGLLFASGAIGSIHLNMIQQPPGHHWEIAGTEGTLAWDNATGLLRLYEPQKQAWKEFFAPQDFDRNVMFMDEINHLIHIARGESQPLCTLEDGITALRLALAACESSRQGRLLRIE